MQAMIRQAELEQAIVDAVAGLNDAIAAARKHDPKMTVSLWSPPQKGYPKQEWHVYDRLGLTITAPRDHAPTKPKEEPDA